MEQTPVVKGEHDEIIVTPAEHGNKATAGTDVIPSSVAGSTIEVADSIAANASETSADGSTNKFHSDIGAAASSGKVAVAAGRENGPPAPPKEDEQKGAAAAAQVGDDHISSKAVSKTASTAKGNRKANPIFWMTRGSPTNENMVMFRTLNRDLNFPNHNDDYIAPLFRDAMHPVRSWWLRNAPGAMRFYRNAVEDRNFGAPGVVNFVDARTKWFDSVVQAAVAAGVEQVVVVAAGFDTRAYRFGSDKLRFFEVDLPKASEHKQKLVDKLLTKGKWPRPVYVAADLSCVSLEEALNLTPFDANLKTLFTVEGLIYYLPPAAVSVLFHSMRKLASPGAQVAFDFLHTDALEGRGPVPPGYKVTAMSVANKGELFVSGIQPEAGAVSEFLGRHDFRLQELLGPQAMAARMLPHLQWNEKLPPILSFYSFVVASV